VTQIATVSTRKGDLRSEIDGWTYEDSSLLVRRGDGERPGIFIGWTPSPRDIPHYGCVLEMLADGWKLLGAPTFDDAPAVGGEWTWWLTRETGGAS
jgi:hypothetical protein